jgi:hypothetical protein
MHLTTATGLAAGSVFSDAAPALVIETRSMVDGISMVPCDSRSGITLQGVGLIQSSLISVPTALETAVSVAGTWTSTTTSGTTTAVTSRSATHTAALASAITGDFWTSHTVTMDSEDPAIGYNRPHASVGGYVAGDNRMGSHEVRIAAGAVSWTQYTAGVSDDTGASGVVTAIDESVSFTVPQGAAVRVAAEPLLTVSWQTFNAVDSWRGDHAISNTPHQDFLAPP